MADYQYCAAGDGRSIHSPLPPSMFPPSTLSADSNVVRRAVRGEKIATAVLEPNSDVRDLSAIVPEFTGSVLVVNRAIPQIDEIYLRLLIM